MQSAADIIVGMVHMDKEKTDFQAKLLYLVIIFSTMVVFQWHNYTFFFIFELLFILFSVFKTRKIIILKDNSINIIYIFLIITTAYCYFFSNMPSSFKRGAVIQMVLIVPSWLILSYVRSGLKKGNCYVPIIRNALKLMCLLQTSWCLLQFILFTAFHIDINDIIFVKSLKFVQEASFYKYGIYLPSGFGWHPSLMAPVVVLGFFLFESPYLKLLCITAAFACKNGTAIIGIIVAVFISLIDLLATRKKKFNKRTIISMCVGIVVIFVIFITTQAFSYIIAQISSLIQRILFSSGEISAMAHVRYYSSYPSIVRQSPFIQILFGYGDGCSGYPFTQLYGQALGYKSWAVESDIINLLISRGLLGFAAFYAVIIKSIIRGKDINKKYTFVFLILLIQGITYNIQNEGLFLIEMILYLLIFFGYDVFDSSDRIDLRR